MDLIADAIDGTGPCKGQENLPSSQGQAEEREAVGAAHPSSVLAHSTEKTGGTHCPTCQCPAQPWLACFALEEASKLTPAAQKKLLDTLYEDWNEDDAREVSETRRKLREERGQDRRKG